MCNHESDEAPDTIPPWVIYSDFAMVPDVTKDGSTAVHGSENEAMEQAILLNNRVLHFDGPNGDCDRSWRVSVSASPDADAGKRWICRTEYPEGVKRENYLYNSARKNFCVKLTDGLQVYNLQVESASSQHVGAVINGKYYPENETIEITFLSGGLRHAVMFNRVSGDGVVYFRQKDGTLSVGWILGKEESQEIHQQSTRRDNLRQMVGHWATDLLASAA